MKHHQKLNIPKEYVTVDEKLQYIQKIKLNHQNSDIFDMDRTSMIYRTEQYYLNLKELNNL